MKFSEYEDKTEPIHSSACLIFSLGYFYKSFTFNLLVMPQQSHCIIPILLKLTFSRIEGTFREICRHEIVN